MKEPNNDWSELEAAWRAHDADPQLMESTLRNRMHAQKLLVLHAVGEGLSFMVAVGVWIWVALRSHAPILGWMMLGALQELLPGVFRSSPCSFLRTPGSRRWRSARGREQAQTRRVLQGGPASCACCE